MLTKLSIRNFKRFDDVEIELGNPVVFVGPNNSGKTTALQAIALWDIGLRRWTEKQRTRKTAPEKRPGVTINRKDLITIPIPDANLLWRDLHVRDVRRSNGTQETRNIRIDIQVEGVTDNQSWKCGLEFDYANDESLYCRPIRISEGRSPKRMEIPPAATGVKIAYLPPMSGLAANETRLDQGAVSVRLGEGRTAEVLRNLCYQVSEQSDGGEGWQGICEQIQHLFNVSLETPRYIAERGEITMTYRSPGQKPLDLSASGRGLQQTLLLLAHMEVNSGCVLLLDEPDAHLELLRQRQTYQLLSKAAEKNSCQIIIASHSEVILNEAADRDVVVAFLGKPHRIDDRGSRLLKSLKQITCDHYYQAEQTGWVLYLEGSTDLAILQAFAEVLDHPAKQAIERPFVEYVGNRISKARDHFHGLREAKSDLLGYVLCDRSDPPLKPDNLLRGHMWQRREIENYLCQPETLLAYAEEHDCEVHARYYAGGALFESQEAKQRRQAMEESIRDNISPAAYRDRNHEWWSSMKASDEFLDRVFESYLKRLKLPVSLMTKRDYHKLAMFVPRELIAPEVEEVLNEILAVSKDAKPRV